jgi:hypothetical protein
LSKLRALIFIPDPHYQDWGPRVFHGVPLSSKRFGENRRFD